MKFKCAHCGVEWSTSHTMFRCPKCKAMQPIEDYKKAFEDLFEQYEEDRRSHGESLGIMYMANDCLKRERNFFIIATVICLIMLLGQWLI